MNLLSYPTLDHLPWVDLSPVEWGHPHQLLIKNMPHMLANLVGTFSQCLLKEVPSSKMTIAYVKLAET